MTAFTPDRAERNLKAFLPPFPPSPSTPPPPAPHGSVAGNRCIAGQTNVEQREGKIPSYSRAVGTVLGRPEHMEWGRVWEDELGIARKWLLPEEYRISGSIVPMLHMFVDVCNLFWGALENIEQT